MRFNDSSSRIAVLLSVVMMMALFAPASLVAQAKASAPAAQVVAGGQAPQARMIGLARKLNLGATRADSASPRATKSGAGQTLPGYYQCFEKGCVYYSAPAGTHAVTGTIFNRFVQEGAERQSLGFPTSDETPCASRTGFRYQQFEGGLIILHPGGTNLTVRAPNPGAGQPVDCNASGVSAVPVVTTGTIQTAPPALEAAPVKPEQATALYATPPSGRYRVTLNGFLVAHETADHSLQVDGKRDEVFILAEVAEFDGRGEVVNRTSPVSVVMGDIDGQEGRIPAGHASSLGGLRSSDQFPDVEPWRRSGAVNPRRPPMLLWEGTLTQGARAVVIVPTIWEWDGPSDLLTQYRRGMTTIFPRYVRTLSASETNFAAFRTPMTGGPGTSRPVGFEPTGNAADRPIGIAVRNGSFLAADEADQGREWFTPQRLLLTYDLARQAVTNTRDGFGPGIFQMTYTDHPELAGVYTLYLQVEKID